MLVRIGCYHDLHQVLLKGLPNVADHILHDLDGAGFCGLQLQELFDQETARRPFLNLKRTLGQHQGQLQAKHVN